MLTDYGFTHLHVASSYSLRYGTATPAALAARAAELGMPALALTDRDGLYGAFKHAQACAEVGLKPILGADLALAGGGRVTLLAEGRQGWASLCRLVTHGLKADPPAVAVEDIAGDGAGLIAVLGLGSDVGQAVAARRMDLAADALRRWRDLGVEVVIEIVDHLDAPGSTHRAARMAGLASQAGLPAVVTNAVRYLDQADGQVAQVLDAARHLVPLGSPKLNTTAQNGRAFLASTAHMTDVAERIAAAFGGSARTLLRQTAELARRCQLDAAKDLGIGRHHLPEPGRRYRQLYTDGQHELRVRCAEALEGRRYRSASGGRKAVRAARERLDHELGIIASTQTASYFLTVADIADRIKARGIRCAIRGSGAGSFVSHLLGISAIDPLEHGLLMERFLSPIRSTLPDIDLDVESARRLEAYQVIFDAYGEQRTACVSMMETYRARSAIRDVAAAMSLPPDEIGRIAKAFPHISARHITSALGDLPELRASNLATPQLATVFRIAERLDGLPRHVAMHPCGILLSDTTLRDRTAMQRSSEGFPLSHLDKDDTDIAGVIKLDVLGVRMQSAMAYTLQEIARTGAAGVGQASTAPDIDTISRDDEPTYAMIEKAKTLGCFQIESPGQRELVRKLVPRDVGDLIVDISLFRPGPVGSDMISPFLQARHGLRAPEFPHGRLREALAETEGVVVYHEQVLRILHIMTDCGLAEADLIRRHLSKDEGPRRTEPWFRAAARRRGYDEATIERVWKMIAAFGGFGFCKAHAAAFAIPVYQSAWLKCHYPAAFYAGVLTHDPGMYPKRVIVADARLSGVPVLPLDVNASGDGWKVEPAPAPAPGPAAGPGIRVSLREVKGISDAEVGRVVAGAPYASLRDFWERARPSRPVAERLALVGAFDSMYEIPQSGHTQPTRRDLLARVGVLDRAATRAGGRGGAAGVPLDLLTGTGADADDGLADIVPAGQLRDLDPAERVSTELDVLGFDVSRHVLEFYEELLEGLAPVRSGQLEGCGHGQTVLVAGVKVATQTPAVRSGQRIIFATLDDAAGLVDLTFFESVQERCAARVFGSWLLLVRGTVRRSGAGPKAATVTASECWDLPALEEIRLREGMDAVRAAMEAGDVGAGQRPSGRYSSRTVVFSSGFAMSRYAETGAPGAPLKVPPRALWHASSGSSGETGDGTSFTEVN
ncbi:MAG TPA: DNA polymerase III subunit alpha [Trebonia sp.]|nr:DNA polymerase III subunit alpha [Trebonia sp.]